MACFPVDLSAACLENTDEGQAGFWLGWGRIQGGDSGCRSPQPRALNEEHSRTEGSVSNALRLGSAGFRERCSGCLGTSLMCVKVSSGR